jgi:hypothetical protein
LIIVVGGALSLICAVWKGSHREDPIPAVEK